MKNKIFGVLGLLLVFSSCRESRPINLSNNDAIQKKTLDSNFLRLPTKSQFANVSQVLGTSEISISYYRPGANNRTIWGDVVKWDTIWRTGAEKSTVFHFDDDAIIGGRIIPKGDYSFFIKPRSSGKWTVILNKNANLYGLTEYKTENDVLRFDVIAVESPFEENLLFIIGDVKGNKANVKLKWANKEILFPIEFDKNISWNKIQTYLGKSSILPDSLMWGNYISIANYCVFTENKDKALFSLGLINKSIDIKESFENLKLKSDLFALLNKIDSASIYAKKAHKLGATTGMPLEVANLLEVNIKKYSLLKEK